jgi:hypothetical protein
MRGAWPITFGGGPAPLTSRLSGESRRRSFDFAHKAVGVENKGSWFPSLSPATPRTKSCPFTAASKDRFPHPNEQKSLATTPRSKCRFLGAPVFGDPESMGTPAKREWGTQFYYSDLGIRPLIAMRLR